MSLVDSAGWFAVHVRPQHEDKVAVQLEYRGQDTLLPRVTQQRLWSDRTVHTPRPLFPGYVFCRTNRSMFGAVLGVPGVIRIVSFGGKPYPVSKEEMESLQMMMASGRDMASRPYSAPGQRVRVKEGSLSGMTGVIDRDPQRDRLIVPFDLVMRSVAIDIYLTEIEPIL